MTNTVQHPTRAQVTEWLAALKRDGIPDTCAIGYVFGTPLGTRPNVGDIRALEAENERLRAAHDRPVEVAVHASLRLAEQAVLLKQAREVLLVILPFLAHHSHCDEPRTDVCTCGMQGTAVWARATIRAIDALKIGDTA